MYSSSSDVQGIEKTNYDDQWPKISIVTPSLNQAKHLNTCIRSVIGQNYPNYEYIVMDGGSNDGSYEIIKSYEPWLDDWVSEKDNGQSDAINKGFARCSGDILYWLCADDMIAPGALRTVGEIFKQHSATDVVAGACICQYENSPNIQTMTKSSGGVKWLQNPYLAGIWQPACFFRRKALRRGSVLRNELHYCMDRELWCHLVANNTAWEFTEKILGTYRFTGENKSMIGGEAIIDEISTVFQQYYPLYRGLPKIIKTKWLPHAITATLETRNLHRRLHAKWISKITTAALLTAYPKRHVRALQNEMFCYRFWNPNNDWRQPNNSDSDSKMHLSLKKNERLRITS